MIKLGTFVLLATLLFSGFAGAQDFRVSKMLLSDRPSRRSFNISQGVRSGPKMPSDMKVHLRDWTSISARDLTGQIKFNKIESSFDLSYFYVGVTSDLFLVIPPDEDAATYPELIRSIRFFDEAFNNKIPPDDIDGFSPRLPFLINKSTGAMRNLERQVPSAYAIKTAFPDTGNYIFPSVRHEAAIEAPLKLRAGPGYNYVEVPRADGSVQVYFDRRVPGLIFCEELLNTPSKFRRSP